MAVARETDDEREARLELAGAWLKAELKKRSWSQTYLAERLDVTQQQVSAYVKGRHEIGGKLARDLARVLDLPEPEVFRGMGLYMPRQFETDDALVAYALEHFPNSMAAAKADGTGPKKRNPGTKRVPRPRTGESGAMASRKTGSAI